MVMLENGLLKLAATKTLGMALPLGVLAVAAIWAWNSGNRRSAASPHDDNSAAGPMHQASAGGSPREAPDTTEPAPRKHSSYRPRPGSSMPGGTDREALLSQVLEENIRLREALK